MPGTRLAAIGCMKTAIFFASREGQTRRIAQRIAADLRASGATVDLFDLAAAPAVVLSDYASACVASSVHIGRHERAAIEFVKRHRAELEQLSAVFVSVSLSEAGAEDQHRSESERRQSAADVQRMIDAFVKETGWRPTRVFPVAGALVYTRYNVLLRFVMKRIARRAGGPTDTTRDHELTDWAAVDRFAETILYADAANGSVGPAVGAASP
jgi:menaquinone-dependent protoporphyrinogen oxidase